MFAPSVSGPEPLDEESRGRPRTPRSTSVHTVEALRSAARRLGGLLNPARLIEQIVRLPVPEVADLCVYFDLEAGGGPVPWVHAHEGRDGRRGVLVGSGAWDRDVVADATWLDDIANGAAESVEPTPGDPVEAFVARPGGAFRAVAVRGLSDVAGALVFHRADGGFDDTEVDALVDYAERVGTALASAHLYQYQARAASTLKAALVPEPLPDIPHAVLGAAFRSAFEAERIGGDFYEVHEVPGGFDFSFGDVSGKGDEAAVLTGRIRQSLEALRLVEHDPLRLMEHLNLLLLRTDPEKFSTMVLGRVTPLPAGGLRVRAAGGGHPPPLVVGVDGRVREEYIGGIFVGAIEDAPFRDREFDLAPGETLVVYSDGVTEARNPLSGGQMVGEERVHGVLAECAGMPAPVVCERLVQYVDDWLGGEEHDDITVLAVQAPAAGPDVTP
ncbi:PP2C family protein-serine/threonine phosphatase [Nocardiopsis sp. MG754419]|uniref:PP2C family protein-serine/threonine phosphatase n=1 Tax=Nocardiopsis sp. MG754419 TaxID=2259865 RepID=UPI001BAA7B1D|nr:PP2C family protein-serine/threonine phosphatase [Nocardiopsis sp. MG754419]MBR8742988.1 serine/threonine-protein phosphatase [Nocardiopsis sp. MG754419]